MGPPLPFFAGLLVLFVARDKLPPVTGSGTVEHLASFALLLAVPSLLALVAGHSVRSQLASGRRGRMPPRALLRLSGLSVPLVAFAVLVPGGWSDIGSRLAGTSHLADIGLLLVPLFVAEIPRIFWATAAEACVEVAEGVPPGRVVDPRVLPGFRDLLPLVRMRLSWPLLVLMPCALFGIGLDLLQSDRRAHMFFLGTSPGSTAGMLVMLGAATMVLPAWFRVAFGVVRTLPEPVGTLLRQTAQALGFPPSRVLLLPTGGRALNAMMVGPLPIGRFLCLTDGIVATLDPDSLTGVVAHEVGHAQKGHPLLLLSLAVGVPMLLPPLFGLVELPELDVTSQALLAVGGIVIVWSLVRALAHRFEHEADAASVRALGAGPCSRALMVVSRHAIPMSAGFVRRLLSLHPEEQERWTFMRRYEGEPAFRERFEARGRSLRRTLLAVLGLAAIGAGFAWTIEWPFEKAIWRFHIGDFRGARAAVASIGEDVPERWRETWQRFREELDAAVEIAPLAEDWEAARAGIEANAWARGIEVLRSRGASAAAPWFSLASQVDTSVLCGAMLDYCRATDDARREQAKAVVRRVGVPPGLEAVFAD